MVLLKVNRRKYVSAIHGRGLYGRYKRIPIRQGGYGIMDSLGKSASKYVLGGIGRSTGSFAGKKLGRLIGETTGSKLLGTIAKAGLSSLGGVMGSKLGSVSGKLLGNTVFSDKETQEKDKKKKKQSEQKETAKVSLSSLLDQARSKIGEAISPNQDASGILLH
ncbi:MAG TPA: hypothetical protein PLS50_04710 [Candidatus Dojkabacteria bacterium]|nr:hypothetical protein [Candidatus Dojkabacteria bacterium]